MAAILTQREIHKSLPLYPDCSPQESRLLHIFLEHSIEIMTPWHGGNFWQDHVPRRGHFEPATRHAMIAMVGYIFREKSSISIPQSHLFHIII